jgi:hypothetical protein
MAYTLRLPPEPTPSPTPPRSMGLSPSPEGPVIPVIPETVEQARRVAAFQAQLAAWQAAGRTGVPLLTLPDAPVPTRGHCVSCGTPIPEGHWRCRLCLEALAQALHFPPVPEPPS